MKKIISILSILFIAFNSFGQGHITVKVGGGGGGSGTVTSVAKGYGMLPDGTITTTGTVTVDSATLALTFKRNSDSTDVSMLNGGKIDTVHLPITNIYTSRGTGHTNDSTIITMSHVYSQSSTDTLKINADTTDMAILTTQAVNLFIANPTGTILDGQRIVIRIYTSSVETIGFDTKFRFGSNSTAPTATSSSKTMYMEFIYNADDDTLDMLNPYNNF